jgi:hypothetical protein
VRRPKTALDASRAQEARIAGIRGGTLHAGSGNQWRHKNDLRDEQCLWEMKHTDGEKQITIKVKDLEELRTNAILADRMPVFHVQIGRDGKKYVILQEDDFLELIERPTA